MVLGVFEGVRAYHTADKGTCIFRLEEHTDRLFSFGENITNGYALGQGGVE